MENHIKRKTLELAESSNENIFLSASFSDPMSHTHTHFCFFIFFLINHKQLNTKTQTLNICNPILLLKVFYIFPPKIILILNKAVETRYTKLCGLEIVLFSIKQLE